MSVKESLASKRFFLHPFPSLDLFIFIHSNIFLKILQVIFFPREDEIRLPTGAASNSTTATPGKSGILSLLLDQYFSCIGWTVKSQIQVHQALF